VSAAGRQRADTAAAGQPYNGEWETLNVDQDGNWVRFAWQFSAIKGEELNVNLDWPGDARVVSLAKMAPLASGARPVRTAAGTVLE
jgi:hypothetical protein